jgi:hypothetical protein
MFLNNPGGMILKNDIVDLGPDGILLGGAFLVGRQFTAIA